MACKRNIGVLVDAKLEAEAPFWVGRYARTPERKAEELRDWLRGFEEFIRDHRSQDAVQLSIVEVRMDLCSKCHKEWETYKEDDVVYCANCGETYE